MSQSSYVYVTVDEIGSPYNLNSPPEVNAISDSGEVVGQYATSSGTLSVYSGYFYENGTFTTFETATATTTGTLSVGPFFDPVGVNDSGEIIGNSFFGGASKVLSILTGALRQ